MSTDVQIRNLRFASSSHVRSLGKPTKQISSKSLPRLYAGAHIVLMKNLLDAAEKRVEQDALLANMQDPYAERRLALEERKIAHAEKKLLVDIAIAKAAQKDQKKDAEP